MENFDMKSTPPSCLSSLSQRFNVIDQYPQYIHNQFPVNINSTYPPNLATDYILSQLISKFKKGIHERIIFRTKDK